MGPEVKSLVYTGEYLYTGGNYNQVAGLPIWNIARWDGMSWEALATEILPDVDQLHNHDGAPSKGFPTQHCWVQYHTLHHRQQSNVQRLYNYALMRANEPAR